MADVAGVWCDAVFVHVADRGRLDPIDSPMIDEARGSRPAFNELHDGARRRPAV